ncbi:MAG: hypothetical protein ACRDNK_04695 [Solirubrobacteraceae bacterium]
MSRRFSSVVGLLAVVMLLGAVASAGAQGPVARATTGCGVGAGKGYGYSYLTSLKVRRTSCATGRSVAKHHGRLRSWSCTKKRLDTSPVQYDDRETCHSGARQVVWTFTQNT